MTKKQPSIDGFVPRANQRPIDRFKSSPKAREDQVPTLDGMQRQAINEAPENLHEAEADFEINFNDLDVAEKEQITHTKKSWWRRRKDKKKKPLWRRILKRTILVGSFSVLLIGGLIGLRAFLAANNIIDRNGNCPIILCDSSNAAALQGEGDGRVNILLVGIGGEDHEAGDLADSIIIASIDPIAKEAAMLSVPRDLYLDIPEFGSSRVNAAHAFGEQYGFEKANYPGGGVGLLQETLEDALDVPIHYYLRVDFTAFRDAVDNVGGVDVTLEEALYDPTFWWQFGILDLQPGDHTLDGTTALMYVRSRKTSARGDFDRSERQREVILSLKDKVLSLDTFSDPRKIIGLIDTLGSNVRTNIQLSEMLRLYEISEEITADKIVSVGLGDEGTNFLSGADIGGAAVLVPSSGDFTQIQEFVRSIFVDGFIKSEAAQISVLNGTAAPGVATNTTAELESYGYSVALVDQAPTTDFQQTILYDLSEDGSKDFTKRLLEQRFGVTAQSGSLVPEGVYTEGIDFVVIVGADRVSE